VVTITNAGSGAAEGSILITVEASEIEGEPIVGQVTEEISLPAGEEQSFSVAIKGEMPATVRVTIDADDNINESNERNNSLIVPLS
jgi:subtilase family serine protease